jgi:hypothetical protein
MPILIENDCPLLPENRKSGLIDAVNDVSSKLEELKTNANGMESFIEEIKEYDERLGIIKTKITRKFYRVGFLGTTQAGKSTTFNNILNVSKANAPAKSGVGDATTAAPSRLRRCNPDQIGLYVNFMNASDFEIRKKRLVKHLNLSEILTEKELIDLCRDYRKKLKNGDIIPGISLVNILSLETLLLSKKENHTRLQNGITRTRIEANYNDRENYLNHINNNNTEPIPSEKRLIWEVEINFPNEVLPSNIEILDLPGLGSGKYHDDCVTLDILEKTGEEGLDGALVFIRSIQQNNDSVNKVLETLQNTWGRRFKGRVWLVFSQFDALTEEHINNNPNWFDETKKICNDYNIPQNCIFFTGNIVYSRIQTYLKETPTVDQNTIFEIARTGTIHNLPLDAKPFTDTIERFNAGNQPINFKPVLENYYLNGGIEYLRNAIINDLSKMIGEEVADDVQNLTKLLRSDIESSLRILERRRNQTNEDLKNANTCSKQMHNIVRTIKKGMPEFKEATTKIRNSLQASALEHALVDDLADMVPDQIPVRFPVIAKVLDNKACNLLIDEGVDRIYNSIKTQIQDLPIFPICNHDSIQLAWQHFQNNDSDAPSWKEDVPVFNQPELINAITGAANPLDGDQFKILLENKMDVVTLVSMFRLQERVMTHLGKINRDLDRLVTNP